MSKVVQLERFMSWDELGRDLGGRSKRWLEERVSEGMPSYLIGGRRAFRFSEAVRWLEANGHIQRDAA